MKTRYRRVGANGDVIIYYKDEEGKFASPPRKSKWITVEDIPTLPRCPIPGCHICKKPVSVSVVRFSPPDPVPVAISLWDVISSLFWF